VPGLVEPERDQARVAPAPVDSLDQRRHQLRAVGVTAGKQ
jgi:hypothetical protein